MDTEIVKKEDVMVTFDKLDESQALAELKGASLQEYVYSFKDKGVAVTGLSLVGVRETVREMNKRGFSRTGIADTAPIINETDDYIEVQTYAKDELNGGGYWGIKRQPKKFSTGTLNRFCMEQALSKAQRNAMRGLIPEPFVKEMIATYLGEGKSRKVTTSEVQSSKSEEGTGSNKKVNKKLDTENKKLNAETFIVNGGKYDGKQLLDCPSHWINWLIEQIDSGEWDMSKRGYDNTEYIQMMQKALEIKDADKAK